MKETTLERGNWSALEDIPVGLVLIEAMLGRPVACGTDATVMKAKGELVYYAYTQRAVLRLLEILSFDKYMNWAEVLGNIPTPAEITIPKAGVLVKGKVPIRAYTLDPVELAFLGDVGGRDLFHRMNAVENKLIAEGKISDRYNAGIVYNAQN